MSEKQNDRVSYSFGMKLSLPEKYESVDFHINLSSDVNVGETIDQAYARVMYIVETEGGKKFSELRTKGYEVVSKTFTPAVTKPVEKPVSKATEGMIKQVFLTLQTRNGLTSEKFKQQFLGGRGLSTIPATEFDAIYSSINKYIKETKDGK